MWLPKAKPWHVSRYPNTTAPKHASLWCSQNSVCLEMSLTFRLQRKKHSYAEARVVRFHQLSPVRHPPPAPHFGICGGCKWQQLPYEAQLAAKQKQVADQLRRIGKVALPELRPIMGSVEQFEYRNKLEFGFSNKKWLTHEQISSGEVIENMNALGFHITGAFDKILHIEKCCLMDDLHNRIRNAIYSYAVDNQLSFFDLRQQTGLLRDMMIRNSNSGEWMVLIQFHFATPGGEGLEKQQAEGLLNHLADEFPQISSLLWVDNQKRNNTFADLPINVYKGNDHIFELMENLRFKVGPKSFYQTNTLQAYRLYSVARDFAFGDGTAESSKPPCLRPIHRHRHHCQLRVGPCQQGYRHRICGRCHRGRKGELGD